MDNEFLVILPLQGRTSLSQSDREALDAAAGFAEKFKASLSCLLLNNRTGGLIEELRSLPLPTRTPDPRRQTPDARPRPSAASLFRWTPVVQSSP